MLTIYYCLTTTIHAEDPAWYTCNKKAKKILPEIKGFSDGLSSYSISQKSRATREYPASVPSHFSRGGLWQAITNIVPHHFNPFMKPAMIYSIYCVMLRGLYCVSLEAANVATTLDTVYTCWLTTDLFTGCVGMCWHVGCHLVLLHAQ